MDKITLLYALTSLLATPTRHAWDPNSLAADRQAETAQGRHGSGGISTGWFGVSMERAERRSKLKFSADAITTA